MILQYLSSSKWKVCLGSGSVWWDIWLGHLHLVTEKKIHKRAWQLNPACVYCHYHNPRILRTHSDSETQFYIQYTHTHARTQVSQALSCSPCVKSCLTFVFMTYHVHKPPTPTISPHTDMYKHTHMFSHPLTLHFRCQHQRRTIPHLRDSGWLNQTILLFLMWGKRLRKLRENAGVHKHKHTHTQSIILLCSDKKHYWGQMDTHLFDLR